MLCLLNYCKNISSVEQRQGSKAYLGFLIFWKKIVTTESNKLKVELRSYGGWRLSYVLSRGLTLRETRSDILVLTPKYLSLRVDVVEVVTEIRPLNSNPLHVVQ